MSRRTSIIWTIPAKELQHLLDTSSTMKEVMEKMGINTTVPQGAYNRRLNQRIEEEPLSTEKLDENRKLYWSDHNTVVNRFKRLSDDECFCENSKASSKIVKSRILKDNIIEYQCHGIHGCGGGCTVNSDDWNGQPISLQLDHVNGINNDHRLENLRFVCPNCHSQTDTFGAKNRVTPKVSKKCADCGTDIYKTSHRCRSCVASTRHRFGKRNKEIADKMDELNDVEAVAQFFNLSIPTIRKYIRPIKVEY